MLLLEELETCDSSLTGIDRIGVTTPVAPSSATPKSRRRGFRVSWLSLGWLFGCLILASGMLAYGHFTRENSSPAITSIEQIRVGQRALVDVPASALAADEHASTELDLTEIRPDGWRLIRMRAEEIWEDGTLDDINVETLQPLSWLAQHQIAIGEDAPIPLDLVEMGLPSDLRATVVAIEPCPIIKHGSGRIVLTTVNHLHNALLELTLRDSQGKKETLRPTAPHKFYSVNRNAWLSASDLIDGETLSGVGNQNVTVVSVKPLPGIHRVYNMTVQGEHVYRVANSGVLVHNMECEMADPRSLRFTQATAV